jgi:hypothetical protein
LRLRLCNHKQKRQRQPTQACTRSRSSRD